MDTNIVVRALTGDDARQSAKARAILTENFIITAGVLIEVEWVLRSMYKWSRAEIVAGFEGLADLPALIEAPPAFGWAIERFALGADFADMMHLVASGAASTFVTFDRALARKAGANAPIPIETLA